jgi:hypothetical protein
MPAPEMSLAAPPITQLPEPPIFMLPPELPTPPEPPAPTADEAQPPGFMPAWPTSAIHQPVPAADRVVAHVTPVGRQPSAPGSAISALPPISALPAVGARPSAGTVYPASSGTATPASPPAPDPPPAAGAQPQSPAPSARYGEWARGQRSPANQRPQGTVYGRGAAVPVAVFPTGTALENSGSLTGHILSQGAADVPPPKARTARVIVIIVVILLVLVAGGLAVAYFAQDWVNGLFDNIRRG